MVKFNIRLIKPLLNALSLTAMRRWQNRIGRFGKRKREKKLLFVDAPFDNFRACWLIPKDEPRATEDGRSYILYLHGGGYALGNIEYAKVLGGTLASETKRRTLCVEYRLAPENPFPAAVDDALEAYKYMLGQGISSDRIALCGESAGGGLVYALFLKLNEENLPLPQCLVTLSPWADLSMAGESYRVNEQHDPSFRRPLIERTAAMYAGEDFLNPLVSPVFGDFTNCPPSLIFVGDIEMLFDDSQTLCRRLKECGAECELDIGHGLWHVYLMFPIKEARDAMKRIVNFLRDKG